MCTCQDAGLWWCREYNRADTNSKRGRDRDERERLRGIERDERDRRRVEAMHAKRYPIDDLDLIAEQRHRSSYTSGSACASLTPVLLTPATHSHTSPLTLTLKIDRSLTSCYAKSLRLSALCGWGGRGVGCRVFLWVSMIQRPEQLCSSHTCYSCQAGHQLTQPGL